MKAYFKCRPCGNSSLGLHIAWCGFRPLTARDATREPQEPVYFGFGPTEEKAVADMKNGLNNVTEWERQPA